jgi:hypothetical protein
LYKFIDEKFVTRLTLKSGVPTWALTGPLSCPGLRAIDSAKCEMMNSVNILQFAKSVENLLFLINSASSEIKVEFYILIRF